jgi:hypothetical protein
LRDDPIPANRGASTNEDTTAASGPTGPVGGIIHAVVDDVNVPRTGFRYAVRSAAGPVSHEGSERRRLQRSRIATDAHLAGQNVADDGDATQHQGIQVLHGHCRPPTLDERKDDRDPH